MAKIKASWICANFQPNSADCENCDNELKQCFENKQKPKPKPKTTPKKKSSKKKK